MRDALKATRRRLADALDSRVRAQVGGELDALRLETLALKGAIDAATGAADRLDHTLAGAQGRIAPGPFRAEMTVHAAHARHPRTREVFATRGLPHCPSCAVGADETLAEAASGEGMDLQELLAALRALES